MLNWDFYEPDNGTIRKARAVFPLAAIQSEFNMMYRKLEKILLPVLEELNIGFVPYRPLVGGFLSNLYCGKYLTETTNTRFSKENLKHNNQLKELLINLTTEKTLLSLNWLWRG